MQNGVQKKEKGKTKNVCRIVKYDVSMLGKSCREKKLD